MSVRRRSGARSPFPWFGGKQRLAEDIVALFPAHLVAGPRAAHPTLFTHAGDAA